MNAERETDLKYKYDNVETLFIDEISMVGSGKLGKINYRLQDLVDDQRCKDYMGGISFVASGNLDNDTLGIILKQ